MHIHPHCPPHPNSHTHTHIQTLIPYLSDTGSPSSADRQGRSQRWPHTQDTCWRWWPGQQWTVLLPLDQRTPQTCPPRRPDAGAVKENDNSYTNLPVAYDDAGAAKESDNSYTNLPTTHDECAVKENDNSYANLPITHDECAVKENENS